MPHASEKLAQTIKDLVDELAGMIQARPRSRARSKVSSKNAKGASGALSFLINDGFFDAPKDLTLVMNKMAEIGRYYSRPSVAMNLLNLTKKRTLTRIKDKQSANWKYVIRK
jgi:hypothetical protein